MLLFIAALAASSPSDVAWLSGYWLSCEKSREVSETWSEPEDGALTNTTLTRQGGKLTIEIADIKARDGTLVFHAKPPGQPAADFVLKTATATSVVFENPTHDFPQRVSYRREGAVLHAQIDGEIGGKTQVQTWTYRAMPMNSSCP